MLQFFAADCDAARNVERCLIGDAGRDECIARGDRRQRRDRNDRRCWRAEVEGDAAGGGVETDRVRVENRLTERTGTAVCARRDSEIAKNIEKCARSSRYGTR